jgi:hypothetical protein
MTVGALLIIRHHDVPIRPVMNPLQEQVDMIKFTSETTSSAGQFSALRDLLDHVNARVLELRDEVASQSTQIAQLREELSRIKRVIDHD